MRKLRPIKLGPSNCRAIVPEYLITTKDKSPPLSGLTCLIAVVRELSDLHRSSTFPSKDVYLANVGWTPLGSDDMKFVAGPRVTFNSEK